MKHILVTGAAGFIGHKVSELLLERKFRVMGIDNLNDYYDVNLKKWRLSQLKKQKDFLFFKGDISNFSKIRQMFANHRIDAVINLAARAGVRASVEDPWVYLDTNAKGALNLLECCKTFRVKTFVQASTSSLYANNKMPFREDSSTDTPLAPYAATKKAAEALCYSYHYLQGINTIIPRYFTVYGPAGRPDMSYFRFIENIMKGKPITVFGDGKQIRDFTYIDDIAEGTVRCLDLKGYEIINLGNDRPVELMYLIGLIEQNLGKKARIKYLPMHPADVKATWADIKKAKRLLKWKPSVSIEAGIERTVDWFRHENK